MVTKINIIRRRGSLAELASISLRSRKRRKQGSVELPTNGQGGDVVDLTNATSPYFKSNDDDERKTAGHFPLNNDNSYREKLRYSWNHSWNEDSKSNELSSPSKKKWYTSEKIGTKIIIDLEGVPDQLPILKDSGKGTSRYKGVHFAQSKGKWFARITIEGRNYYIGSYDDELTAAQDYARAVLKYIYLRKPAIRNRLVEWQKTNNMIMYRGQSEIYMGVSCQKASTKWATAT